VTPSLRALLLPTLTSTAFVGLAIAAAFALVHAEQRRARRRSIRAARVLGARLEAFLAGRVGAGALRRAAWGARSGRFWSAVEALPLEQHRAWRRTLGAALAGNPHSRRERHALEDESPWRRELAARRLARLEEPASRVALRRALERHTDASAEACARALGRYRDARALHQLLRRPALVVRRGARAGFGLLRAFGRGALPAIADALAAGPLDPAFERALIEALGTGGHAAASAAIAQRLASPDTEVRVAAARALGRLQTRERAGDLEGALADPAWPVRAMAAWALGQAGDAPARTTIAALTARLTDRVWWVRRHAAYALRELGAAGREALRRTAEGSPDPYARDIAREALGSGESLGAA